MSLLLYFIVLCCIVFYPYVYIWYAQPVVVYITKLCPYVRYNMKESCAIPQVRFYDVARLRNVPRKASPVAIFELVLNLLATD